jgi:hypothetical protein
MEGTGVSNATTSVDVEVAAEIETCVSFPCVLAVDDTKAYGDLMDVCDAAGGVFYEFALEVTCASTSYQFDNWPVCWKSPDVNSACTADSAEGALESGMDVEGCTEVASLTGTTDFSDSTGSAPMDPPSTAPSCMITTNAVEAARDSLSTEILTDANDCSARLCEVDVETVEGFDDLKDACELAAGAFHLQSVNVTCSTVTYRLSNVPECFVSESENSECTTDLLEDYFEDFWDNENCTESASHTSTTDFSGSGPTGSAPADPPASSPGSCQIESNEVDTARTDLDAQVVPDASACSSDPCVINVESYQEFSAMLDACKAAGGSFHVFSVVLKCSSRTVQFNDYPECLVSEKMNSNCTINFSEAYMEMLWDNDNCTETANHTSTTDFSGSAPVGSEPTAPPVSPPSSCVIPSDVVDTARYNLDNELLGDLDCQTSPCMYEVKSLQEYSEMKEACKGEDGALHVFTVVLECPTYTLQFNDYPDCFVSQTRNSECTRDYLEAYMDFLWDQDNGNCTTTSSETEVIDFSGASDVPTPPPAFPTDPPAFPTDPPATPTDAPVSAIPPEAGECSLSADGVYSANNDLIDEVASFLDDCLSPPCIIEVDTTQAYSDLMDACEEAKGAFHLFTVDVSCTEYTFQYIKFPGCWVSEEINPVCDPDILGDVLELELFDSEGCTETATHTNTTDFGTQDDNPDDSEAPSRAPAGTQTTPALQTAAPSSTRDAPSATSSALSMMAPKSRCSIVLAVTLFLACSPWI